MYLSKVLVSLIEIHTGRFADAETEAERQVEFERIRVAVDAGVKAGLHVNAGHGLHYQNVQPVAALVDIRELNIGHAIIAHAVFNGLQNSVKEMKRLMVDARMQALEGNS